MPHQRIETMTMLDQHTARTLAAKLSAPLKQVEQEKFCCAHSWEAAKQLAWRAAQKSGCGCDRIEYCEKCWPLSFRAGGKWEQYAP
jgi:hypothetical protein